MITDNSWGHLFTFPHLKMTVVVNEQRNPTTNDLIQPTPNITPIEIGGCGGNLMGS
jgi:hypothetical protein